MEALPRELIIQELTQRMDEYTRVSFHFAITSNHQLHSICGSMSLVLPTVYDTQFYQFGPKFVWLFWKKVRSGICYGAAVANNFELLKWARVPKSPTVPWLQDQAPLPSNIITAAYRTGSVEVCQWLFDAGVRSFNESMIIRTTERGHLKMLQWLLSKLPNHDIRAVDYAAKRYNRVDILEWLVETNKLRVDGWIQAAEWGAFDVLRWAFDRQFFDPTNVDAFVRSLKSNNPDLVAWFHQFHAVDAVKQVKRVDWVSTVVSTCFPIYKDIPIDTDRLRESINEALIKRDWTVVARLADIATCLHGRAWNKNEVRGVSYSMSYVTDSSSLDILHEKLGFDVDDILSAVVNCGRTDLLHWKSHMFTSKLLVQAYDNTTRNILLALPFQQTDEHRYTAAMRARRLDILRTFPQKPRRIDHVDIVDMIKADNIEMVKFVFANTHSELFKVYRLYAISVEMLSYISKLTTQHYSIDNCRELARIGWLEGLQWLRSPIDLDGSAKPQTPWDKTVSDAAAEYKHWDLLNWLCSPKQYPFQADDICPASTQTLYRLRAAMSWPCSLYE